MLPHNLVLTYMRCDYCEKEDTKCCIIYDNFGIKTCDDHYELGKRDCKYYLQSNDMIHLQDVQQLVDALPKSFPILRSSGEMQDGWSLDFDDPYLRKIYGNWHIPCVNLTKYLTKRPSINDMTHIIDVESMKRLISLAESHFYTEQPLVEYKEHPAIQRIMTEGGECRVFVIPSHQDSA